MSSRLKGIKDLALRYGLSEQGMRKFIRQHLAELNSDRQHVRHRGKAWLFDDEAVRRIDELRGVSISDETETTSAAVYVDTATDSAKFSEQLARLSELILLNQVEFARRQREVEELIAKVSETQARLDETITRLNEMQTPQSETKSTQKETSTRRAKLKNWFERFKFW